MNNDKITGSCLCGTVRYQYSGPVKVFQYCHCTRCRKVTGAAHASNIIIDPSHFSWLAGESSVGRYELPAGIHFATSFCKTCGSSLPWLTKSGKAVVVPAGTLDDDPKIKPTQNICMSSKAPWYLESAHLLKYEELPTSKS